MKNPEKKKVGRWSTYFLIFFLAILTILLAYNYFEQPFWQELTTNKLETIIPEMTPTSQEKRQLTDKEKIAQLLALPLDVPTYIEAKKKTEEQSASQASASTTLQTWMIDEEPGFLILYGKNISTQSAGLVIDTITKDSQKGLYPLFAVDHEGGLVQRLSGDGFSQLDSWQHIVENYSSAAQKATFTQSAEELSAVGIQIVFAPVVDIASESAILKTRVAADPEKLAQAAENFIESFSFYHIMSVLKHYPGIGSVTRDLHLYQDQITLNKDDTTIFSILLSRYPNIGVMSSHVQLAGRFQNSPCSLSRDCLAPLLKNYPNALIFSDDLQMKSALKGPSEMEDRSLAKVAIEAIRAGNDVLIFGPKTEKADIEELLYQLEIEYKDSQSFREQVNLSVEKILKLKEQ